VPERFSGKAIEEVTTMKFILGALAAVSLFVGVAASQPAEARCFWNGFGWECVHHGPWWWHRHHHHFYRPYGWW
jgi:hypothetical protein